MISAGLITVSAALLCLIDGSDITQIPLLWMEEGQSATMNCSHTQSDAYFQMYWYRQLPGEKMKQIVFTTPVPPHQYESGFSEDKFPAQKKDVQTGSLTVKKLLLEDSGVYFCAVSEGAYEAYFGQGTKLTVLEDGHDVTTPTVKVLRPSTNECRNQKDNAKKKTLVCVASKFYPDHVSVSWQVNGVNITDGVATDSAAVKEGKFYKITSRLQVPAETWFSPSSEFKCIVSFFNGEVTEHLQYSINGDEVTITREKYLRITQTAKLSYVVFIVKSCIYGAFVAFLVWKLQGAAGKQNN
ncbi:T-cell receptor beta-1 chain C region [Chaetodon trifascialis]|uniref:T-cell receptor beta-1 chain C region n=1 Tax=Chaetodon trifascialis TaxID=109706 RepID=UPI0039917A9A